MKNVLNVGQCSFDHAAIRGLIEDAFEARVTQAHSAREALSALRSASFDLVLVNRKLDADRSDGLEIIKAIKADPALAGNSVILVTNYPEHQRQAVAFGAEPGFGKSQLHEPQTMESLRKFLI